MSWPILLTPAQSEAVLASARRYLDSVSASRGATRAQITIVVSQMERGIALDFEEQDLLRFMLLQDIREHGGGQDIETAFFKLYGAWPVDPPYWSGTLRMRT